VKHVERILVAIDHSPGSDAIVEYACAVARGTGATIELFHAYAPPNEMIGMVPGATVGGETTAERDAGLALLGHAAAIVRGGGLADPSRLVEQAPSAADAIISRARSGAFDLVVVGTHARTGVSRLVLGSVAEQVLRGAPCPVLVVHLPRD
jgi:nucleotide-binding universal stress UspA family protein